MTFVDLKAEGGPLDAGRRLAAAEWALVGHPWLVPRVEGLPPAGYADALAADAQTLSLTVGPDGAELCGAWAGCTAHPTLAIALEDRGWGGDRAILELGTRDARDAATLYGLRKPGRRARGEGSPGALWIRARRQLRGGAPGRAVVILERALAREPGHVGLLVALATALESAGQPKRAARLWREVLERSPDDPRFVAAAAASEASAGDRRAARRLLDRLPPRLRALPPAVAALERAEAPSAAAARLKTAPIPGASDLRSGRPAPEEIERALSASRDPIARVARGEALLARGDARAALRAADAALKGAPWLPEALGLRAAALDGLGRHREADEARADLRYADPGSGIGPRRLPNARELGAAIQSD